MKRSAVNLGKKQYASPRVSTKREKRRSRGMEGPASAGHEPEARALRSITATWSVESVSGWAGAHRRLARALVKERDGSA
jgi:hypothetical protein